MTVIKRFLFILSLILVLGSCSEYKKVVKESDYQAKEKLANELYERKKYARALPLYEELITIYRGTSRAESLYYHYAYCNFGVGDYLLANYWFEYFVGTFPFSAKTEECEYMAAYCFYKDSPREPLEQTNTVKAIRELQIFIDAHPQSPKVAEANGLIDQLRMKLENKDYRVGVQYFNMEYYNACIVSFQNLLRDYPETKRRPEVAYLMVKSAYMYASQSVKSKQKERLVLAHSLYTKYVASLPEGKYKKEATSLDTKVVTELGQIEVHEAAMKKIEDGLFAQGETQYNAMQYEESLVTFDKLLKDFPKSDHMMQISWYSIVASHEVATKTEGSKKKHKLIEAKNNYTKFAPNLKGTRYEKDAAAILESIESQLAKIEDKRS